MPVTPTASQSDASRRNGTRSHGPATAEGRARSAENGRRHGLRGSAFFLLPGESRKAFAELLVGFFRLWQPCDAVEAHEAEQAVRAMWRLKRADALEGDILMERSAAEGAADRAQADRALGTLIRYRARIGREQVQAVRNLEQLLRRPDREPPDAEMLFRVTAATVVRSIGSADPFAEDEIVSNDVGGDEAHEAADPDVWEGQSPAGRPPSDGTFEPDRGEPEQREVESSEQAEGEPTPAASAPSDGWPPLNRQQRRYLERLDRKRQDAACRHGTTSGPPLI